MKIDELLPILEKRFDLNMHRHQEVRWSDIEDILVFNNILLNIVARMENSGGEPDVVSFNSELYYVDFSKESPSERRSLCYDDIALESRKQHKPRSSALAVASAIGITLLTEDEYYQLQLIEDLDLKTSSWILTDEKFRNLGGAKFCEKRYKETFTFHNGADSYYASRGFRGKIKLT